MLREPPGQWTFAIRVGDRLIGTCGPTRMDAASARVFAQNSFATITSNFRAAIVGSGYYSTPSCPDVIQNAANAYLRTKGAVTIAASRNGVFRFNWSVLNALSTSQFGLQGVGAPDDGTLGQIETFEECFANPDCDACWRQQFQNAQNSCAAGFEGFGSYDECVNERARQLTREVCFPSFGGTGTRINAYPWRTPSTETRLHQGEVNRVLAENGYQTIEVDGKLGALTCGASSVATGIDPSVGIPDTCFDHQSEWVLPSLIGQPPPPDCRTMALCNATQSCDQATGECFEDCRKNPSMCGSSQTCDQATGNCVAATTMSTGGIGTGGLAFLAAALLGGIYYFTQVA